MKSKFSAENAESKLKEAQDLMQRVTNIKISEDISNLDKEMQIALSDLVEDDKRI